MMDTFLYIQRIECADGEKQSKKHGDLQIARTASFGRAVGLISAISRPYENRQEAASVDGSSR